MNRVCLSLLGLVLLAGCRGKSGDDWLRQLKDPDVTLRRQAIRELGARPAESSRIVPALVEALRDENPYVRRDAAVMLGKFGPAAKEAIPALNVTVKDTERNVHHAATAAAKKISQQASQ